VSDKWIVDVYVPRSFDVGKILDIEDILRYITDKEISNSIGIEHYIYNFAFNTFDEALVFAKCFMIILKYKSLNGVFMVVYVNGGEK
jgi:hypothetical protein